MPLLKITSREQIPAQYRGTPIGELLEYQNLGRVFAEYDRARLLVGMCMDNRKQLRLPRNFAYVIRTAGGNLRDMEFPMSYAIAAGGVRHLALIAHDDCGMSGLDARKAQFIEGMVGNAGWDRARAERYFMKCAPRYEIGDEAAFIAGEAERIRGLYPGVTVAAMVYTLEDHMLSIVA